MRRALALLLSPVDTRAPAAAGWGMGTATRLPAAFDHAATHGLAPGLYGRAALVDAIARGEAVAVGALAELGFNRLAGYLIGGRAG